jgi:hypothetical protein
MKFGRVFGKLGDFAEEFSHRGEDLHRIYEQLKPIQETIARIGRIAAGAETALITPSSLPPPIQQLASTSLQTPLFRSPSPPPVHDQSRAPLAPTVTKSKGKSKRKYVRRKVLPVSPEKSSQKRKAGTSTS